MHHLLHCVSEFIASALKKDSNSFFSADYLFSQFEKLLLP